MLKQLINTDGISGDEMAVRDAIRKEMKAHVDAVWVDRIGNLIAHKKGSKPTVMLAAHMDEVGLMVKHIEEDGKIRFSTLGGIDSLSLLGQRVKLGRLGGVITTTEVSRGEIVEELPLIKDLYVDTGLAGKELEKKGIRAGTYISFDQCTLCSLGSEKIISGKALDDRIGCHILIELGKRLKRAKSEIYYVFTVQEEIGLYGAKISAYKIEPDWAIVVDMTDDNAKSKRIGEGPCITVKDSEMLGNACINGWLESVARKKHIPFQLDVSDEGTTDALSISISKEGTPTAVVGVAVKNMHTAISIAHMEDIDNTVKLLEGLLKNPPTVCLV